jgi:hypothetical protein
MRREVGSNTLPVQIRGMRGVEFEILLYPWRSRKRDHFAP